MTQTVHTEALQKAQHALRQLIDWLLDHQCDVDESTFIDEAHLVTYQTMQAHGFRSVPSYLARKGVCELELACILCKLPLPYEVRNSWLPGAVAFRNANGGLPLGELV